MPTTYRNCNTCHSAPCVCANTRRDYLRKPRHDATATAGEWTVIDPEAAADYLGNLEAEIAYLRHELHLTIGCLLHDGWSWAKVGEALGITREGAYKAHKTARQDFERFCEGNHGEEGGPAAERALRQRIGIKRGRIVFEVRQDGIVKSRHHKPSLAISAAGRWADARVWKVYPDGRELQVHVN